MDLCDRVARSERRVDQKEQKNRKHGAAVV